MAINDITLALGMRANLTNLQTVSALQSRTQLRLSTGKKVNSAIDDPTAYFTAQTAMHRAGDLSNQKTQMGEAIQTVKAGLQGIDSITSLIQQAQGLAASAQSASATDRASLATQFDALRTQIDQLASDASYKGTNLLTVGSSLTVYFNEANTTSLTITGFDASTTGLAVGASQNNWATNTDVAVATAALTTALSTLRTSAQNLSTNNGVVTARQDFVTKMINTLTEGADQLTTADPNEEAANMLALQTRQQLGVVALQLSNQAQQSILKLF